MSKMKLARRVRYWSFALLLSAVLSTTLLRLIPTSLAQSSGGQFRMQQSVVANGGGGPSTGSGNLSLEGTVGQPAAGDLYRKPPFSHNAGFWFGPGNAPTATPAVLSGRVVTNDGTPLEGVTVTLSGSRILRAITDINGFYSFSSLEIGGFYSVSPARANYSFSPQNRAFTLIADKADAIFTATASGLTANPIDTIEFFVRQQYLDFLQREPDSGGLNYWSAELDRCNGDVACLRLRRLDISAAFFVEAEFQDTGSFVYRLYRASFGRQPSFLEFTNDRAGVIGGTALPAAKLALLDNWVTRSAFLQTYPEGLSHSEFVNRLYDTARLTPFTEERQQAIALLDGGGTRSQIVAGVIENTPFRQREYNPSFVLMQYFGYLRREPDQAGYDFWFDVLSNREPGNYRGMVCSFVTSAEYQRRFSPVLTHSNAECAELH